jgi:hypothetical protein
MTGIQLKAACLSVVSESPVSSISMTLVGRSNGLIPMASLFKTLTTI